MSSFGVSDSGQKIYIPGLVVFLDAAQKRSYPGTGTIWTDLSTTFSDATLYNSVSFSSNNGGYMIFTNDTAFANGNIPSNLTTWTASAWVYALNVSGLPFRVVFGSKTDEPIGLYLGGTDSWGGPGFPYRWGYYDGTNDITGSDITTNTWYNITVTKNSNTYQLYHNGNQVKEQVGVGKDVPEYTLGRTGDGNYPMNGYIATFYLYDRVLNSTQIKQNYDAIRRRFGL